MLLRLVYIVKFLRFQHTRQKHIASFFIPTKEAPALHLAIPNGMGCTDFGIRHNWTDGAKIQIFL